LLLFSAAELARARRARGLALNVPEAIALIADTVCERARDGARLAEARQAGATVLTADEVLPGVVEVVREVRVEAVFDDGSRLVVVPDPFGRPAGTDGPGAIRSAAGSGSDRPPAASSDVASGDVVAVSVRNTADVPISVTSHWHFFEANPRLRFDRSAGYGRRLAIPAGSSVRFDPGVEVPVELIPIGGERVIVGFAGLVDGPLDAPGAKDEALRRAQAWGYLGSDGSEAG
jgi:urease subunit gamma/beta